MARRKRTVRPKKLSREQALGQLGVNLVERTVTEMGSRWTPSGQFEAGIDGYIELADPTTREATGLHLGVQSKAVTRFAGDDDEVKLACKRDDIAYWLGAFPPVILVVSCPATKEAYWLSVNKFFGSPEHRDRTIARFDRRSQRFTAQSYDALLDLARPVGRALTHSPSPVHEVLHSNLVPLREYPPSIFVASSTCGGYAAARARLRERSDEYPPWGWALHKNMLISFTDPESCLLGRLVEPGTVERHDARDWADASDHQKRRVFVELLSGALRDDLGPLGIRYIPDDRVFIFTGSLDRGERGYPFRNLHKQSAITVVARLSSRSRDGREFPYLRHLAFRGHFRRLEDSWYLEVTPTYRFTEDGKRKYRFHQERLAGIKALEGNRAVLSQVLLWNDVLKGNIDLYSRSPRLLHFGDLLTATLHRGITETAWALPPESEREQVDDRQLSLLHTLSEAT